MRTIKEHYEKYWEKKFERFGEDLNPAAAKRLQPIMRLLPKKEELGKVLDAGCGDGTILSLLKKYYKFKPYGVDVSEIAVARAKERGITVAVSDLTERIPFPNEFFNLIICSEVLEHLVFPEKALQEIYRVAKKDAVIIFSIPNVAYIGNRLHFLLGKSIFFNPRFQVSEHLRFWTKTSFEEFLKIHGFEVKKTIGMQGFTNLNKLFKRDSLLSRYLFMKVSKVKV